MSVAEISELSTTERQTLSTGAKNQRTSIMRSLSQKDFDGMHPDRRKELQVEIDLCNRTIAFVAYVRDTELEE